MNYIKNSYVELKKSKFYGYLYYLDNEEDVKKIIDLLKLENKKAKHIVYAYKINGIEKKYEDKEPSNTAGKPILDIINIRKLNNTLIVIVRYFGGTLLGTGPLTRAYSKCASMLVK